MKCDAAIKSTDAYNNSNESQRNHAEGKKLISKDYILHDSNYRHSLKHNYRDA